MRRDKSDTPFLDFFSILNCGFAALLILAFLLINPIAKTGVIKPKTKIMVVITWPKKSVVDIDLWMRGPDGTVTSYQLKDGKYMILARDDLGVSNDTVLINDEPVTILRNVETGTINKLFPGEYVINVHNFSTTLSPVDEKEKYPTPVHIRISRLDPHYEILYEGEFTLRFREEKTLLTFEINDRKAVVDKRTDVQIPLFNSTSGGRPGGL